MAENTKISWTHHTHNHWIGCSKVSEGCRNCYAEEMMDHRFGKVQWGPQGTRKLTSEANRRKPLAWNREAKEKGIRYRVFCASLADVFEDRPELVPWRVDLFRLIDSTPALDWLLLTKRPENVVAMMPPFSSEVIHRKKKPNASSCELNPFAHKTRVIEHDRIRDNVWIGTSIENQQTADERIPHLIQIPARVRFLSCEPLLSEVNLAGWLESGFCPRCDCRCFVRHGGCAGCGCDDAKGLIHWVIVGGESGPNARPMHPDWARSLRDQCQAAGVAFHFKQWGNWEHYEKSGVKPSNAQVVFPCGRMSQHWTAGEKARNGQAGAVWMRPVGKKAAGRLLDGREWNELPEVQ